jgi:CBS-domain-containing membrane protein
MQVMARERFRRLPVVDDSGQAIAIFTQSDFVTYTWEDIFFQVRMMAQATALQNFPTLIIGGGLAVYTILMVLLLR